MEIREGLALKIAICEDDAGQAKMAQAYIRSLAKEFPIEAVEVYTTGDALSKVLEAGAQFDIYLLDIDLPGVSGIALAEQIRSKQPYACIAFSTSYPQYVTHAFALQSAQYFLKPIEKEVFLSAMKKMMKDYTEAWVTLVLENQRTVTLRQQDIIYIEFYHGIMSVWTRERSYGVRVNVKAWKRIWYQRGFLQSHQGYFVNPRHVCAIEADEVLCTDNISCPLSARCRKDFMDQFLEYMQ